MFALTPLFFYESFILVIGAAAVFAFAFFYFRLLRGYHVLRQKYLEIEQNTKQEVDELMKKTHQQAISTIEHSQVLSEEMKKQLTKSLQESAKQESDAYRQVITEVGREIKEESQEVMQDISQEIKQDAVEVQQDFQHQLQVKYDEVNQEVEKYKQQRLSEVDQHISEIIGQVIKEATGKIISLNDQQQLLIDALERAKNEQFF